MRAQAAVSDADLAAALPRGTGLRPIQVGGGELVLEASAGVLGFRAAVRARLSARDGALVIAPDGLLGAIGSLTLFADPRVQVTGVDARAGVRRLRARRPRAAGERGLNGQPTGQRLRPRVCAPASIAPTAGLGL